MKKTPLFIFAFLLSSSLFSQQTVGLFLAEEAAYPGYSLFCPGDTIVFLIDNCGRVVHTWSSEFIPGSAGYIIENGDLLRAGRTTDPQFWYPGGIGGHIERYNWEGDLVWRFDYTNNDHLQHHELKMMPNGNILLLAWEKKTRAEAIALGRNPNLLDNELWPEHLVEIEPSGTSGGTIVWEWHFWDHLIQDYDPGQANFGVVGDHPELLDINAGAAIEQDWIHANAIHYNAELDQIVINSQVLSEFFVIDHSTTTAEAASHSGGVSGKGGDFLYRWGNPQNYDRGTAADQILYHPHNIRWIPQGYPDGGKFMIFNNGLDRPQGDYSSVEVIDPPVDAQGNYALTPGMAYGPPESFWTYTANPETDFYSSHMSSAQRLPNGNTLIDEGNWGRFFEVDANGRTVWQYVNPLTPIGPVSQGDQPFGHGVFKCERYGKNFIGFAGHDLTPGDPIELNPLTIPDNCEGSFVANPADSLKVMPNPIEDRFKVEWLGGEALTIEVVDLMGRRKTLTEVAPGATWIPATDWPEGIYLIRSEERVIKKILKRKL